MHQPATLNDMISNSQYMTISNQQLQTIDNNEW